MKVSFIIPVYKVENYLDECVQSILNQTYQDYEILLVDDGSPDRCPKLCDQWAQADARVKALHKANGGLSDARNFGLKHALGDYVIFVDSDDFWIGIDSLAKLMKVVETNPSCDFISFNCCYYYEETKTYTKWVPYADSLAVATDKDTAMHSLVASGTMPMSACLKVISRKSLSDMQLSFIKGILAEDIPWFIHLLDGSKYCMFVNEYIYAYRQGREGSITSTGGERSFNSLFDILKNEVANIDNRSFSQEAKDALLSFLAYEFCILLTYECEFAQKKHKELLQYKWLLNYTLNPKVRKAALVNKIFGIKITEWVLKFYLKHVKK